jgi:ATP-binding cassette subfamily B protein
VLSWQMTLLALAMTPVFILPTRWTGKRLRAMTREYYDVTATLNANITERFNVAGALLVKLFGRPAVEAGTFEERAGRVRDIGVAQGTCTGIFSASLMLTASLSTALVLGWGGFLGAHQAMQVGTVIALAAYLNRLYGPLTALSNVQVDVMTALVSFDRIFEILDLSPMIAEKPGAVPIPRRPATIEFDHVGFCYPTVGEVALPSLQAGDAMADETARDILADVSFTARPGQLVALVGPSGAGKTTISQLIPRLYDVQSGAVRINGIDVRDATLDSLQAAVGVVTQDAHLFHDTIRANLRYAKPDATEDELMTALRSAQLMPLVESLPDRLDTVVGDRGHRLSGGEKQRVAIARLLLRSPDIVVLDEATAHLDTESETAVHHALKATLAGRTAVVIAHRLSTIRDADLILVISEGRVVERGSHDTLIAASGLYAELCLSQLADEPLAAHAKGP